MMRAVAAVSSLLFLVSSSLWSQSNDTTIVLSETFADPNLMVRWLPQTLARRATEYQIQPDGDQFILHARANASNAALIRPVQSAAAGAEISWRWAVDRGIWDNDRERGRGGDDYAARIFVIFGDRLGSPRTRALCYVWAASQPVGSVYPSPYADQVRMIVVQSGPLNGAWTEERQDIAADYQRAFGEPPTRTIGAVAIMSDTDNTRGQAAARFDDIRVFRVQPPGN